MLDLKEVLHNVYGKLRLHFYMQVYSRFENREATLTTVETFSMEAITTLDHPTVAQFAKAMNISTSNAAYRARMICAPSISSLPRSTRSITASMRPISRSLPTGLRSACRPRTMRNSRRRLI